MINVLLFDIFGDYVIEMRKRSLWPHPNGQKSRENSDPRRQKRAARTFPTPTIAATTGRK